LHEPSLRKGAKFNTPIVKRTINRLTSLILRKISDLIIVHTMTCFEMLSAKERQKARVIPLGICESYIPVALEDTKCILFFGRADEYKGIDLLLMAMEEVWKFDETIQLRILASRGNYMIPGDLDSRIIVTEDGYTEEELDSAILDSYVICIPYFSVSGSAVAARAAGSGRPIVASNLIGLSELVDDDELRFIPGDAKDLSRSLKVALSKAPHVVAVNSLATWNEVAKTHLALYENLVGNQG
jgi:glycosyltransferase involved in cell wall biosynthesis